MVSSDSEISGHTILLSKEQERDPLLTFLNRREDFHGFASRHLEVSIYHGEGDLCPHSKILEFGLAEAAIALPNYNQHEKCPRVEN